MPRFGAFTVLSSCSRCGQPLPINAPVLSVRCGGCNADVAVPAGFWGDLLVLLDDEHDVLTEGKPRHLTSSIASSEARCSWARALPCCGRCGQSLPLDIALDAERDLSCPGCGHGVSVYPAPGWLREVSPTAQQVYSDERSPGRAPPNAPSAGMSDAPKPIVMPCPQCGGTLKLGGDSQRLVQCHFCSADVFLPDALWSRLHPVRTVHEWYVRFDGETVAQRRARVAKEANEHNARVAAEAKKKTGK
jgi:DNA-directed RNA polymerase subunit RPC12/RpoP